MKRQLLLTVLFLCSLLTQAQSFEVDGIKYILYSSGWAEVTVGSTKYSGDLVIPETIEYDGKTYSVTSIGDDAFSRCIGLTSISIPNSVESIWNRAFKGCSSLTSITIPNSVTGICIGAFEDCTGLTSITIPAKYISDSAFENCTGLTSVTIPNSVEGISSSAFLGCSLNSITVDKGNTVYDSRNNCNAIIETETNELIIGCKNTVIPNSVTGIGEWAFDRCSGLVSIVIPSSVIYIGRGAFFGCSSLTSITIPNSVENIGMQAFVNCSGLVSVTIPNSVTYIGEYAFYECSGLTEVYCMATEVPTTELNAFKGVDLSKVVLHVPEGCKEKYAAQTPWNQFKEIVEIGEGQGENVVPELTLAATAENGQVKLQFNSLENDYAYVIYRTDAEGEKRILQTDWGNWYPDKIEYVDVPAAGDYTYQAKVVYTDDGGVKSYVLSDEVKVTVTKPAASEEKPPVIAVNANVTDGIVNFKFNSVPNGEKYIVVRKYPNGKLRQVDIVESADYPVALQATDIPAQGTYTYYVDGIYYGADGEPKHVLSNECSITVEQASSSIKRATIHGYLSYNGEKEPRLHDYKVYINGIDAPDTDFHFEKVNAKRFEICDVPLTTQITIGIKQNGYKFEDQTIIVSEKTGNNLYEFKGTRSADEELFSEDEVVGPRLANKIRLTQAGWEIPVWYNSEKTWQGNLIVKVISQKVKEKFDKDDSGEINSALDNLYYNTDICFTTVADMPVEIKGKNTNSVVLDIKDMPNSEKNEKYYVYVFVKEKGTGTKEMMAVSESVPNPQLIEFNPSDYMQIKKYLDVSVEIMKYMKDFASWGDPFTLAWKKVPEQAWNNFIKKYNSGIDKDLLQDEFDSYMKSAGLFMHAVCGEMNQKIVKALTENAASKVLEKIAALHKEAQDLLGAVESVSKADDRHRFFEMSKLVLKYGMKGDPLIDIYKTYFEVAEKTVDAIENIEKKMHTMNVWSRLDNGNAVYRIKVRKDATAKEGAVYFWGNDIYKQIDNISITLKGEGVPEVTKMPTDGNLLITNDGIEIKNLKFGTTNGIGSGNVEAWMTIEWKNNRVTYVPLLDDEFVRIENLNNGEIDYANPLTMTVEFQSGIFYHPDYMANKLTFVKP